MHGNKVDNQITTKLWIIKTFLNIYLQDNHHFRDLNIQKRSLIFRIQIKNVSKCKSQLKQKLKKGVQSGPKLKRGCNTHEGQSALLECRLAQIQGLAQGLLD